MKTEEKQINSVVFCPLESCRVPIPWINLFSLESKREFPLHPQKAGLEKVEKMGKGRGRRKRSKLWSGIPSWHSQETQGAPGKSQPGVFSALPGNPAVPGVSRFQGERNGGNLTWKRWGRRWNSNKSAEYSLL